MGIGEAKGDYPLGECYSKCCCNDLASTAAAERNRYGMA